jgi:hypothetical protein
MSRTLSLTSSFFSAAFVILLVLSFLVLSGPAVADELLGAGPLLNPACTYVSGLTCPVESTCPNNGHCCEGEYDDEEEYCCLCQDTACVGNESCGV